MKQRSFMKSDGILNNSRGKIFEDGALVFLGEAHLVGDTWLLTGDGEEVYFDMQIKTVYLRSIPMRSFFLITAVSTAGR